MQKKNPKTRCERRSIDKAEPVHRDDEKALKTITNKMKQFYDCAYGTYHWIYVMGKLAGADTTWTSGIFNCNTRGIDYWTLDRTCRQNERD